MHSQIPKWAWAGMIVFLIIMAAYAVCKGIKANAEYEPTEVEKLQLQVLQKDAILYQNQLNTIQAQFNDAVAKLNTKADEVKRAHGWDEKTQFNPTTMKFTAPPVPVEKPKEPKEPKK